MDSLWRATIWAVSWTAAAVSVALVAVFLATQPDPSIESILLALGAALVVGAAGATFAAWSVARPLRRFIKEVEFTLAAADTTPDARIDRQSGEEYTTLATAFNTLLERLAVHKADLGTVRAEQARGKAESSEKLREMHEHYEVNHQRRNAFVARWRSALTDSIERIESAANRLLDVRLAPNERFERIETIRRAAAQFRDNFTTVADLCTAQTDTAPPTPRRCDTAELIDAALRPIWREARQRRIPIEIACETPLPQAIEVDPDRLREALRHLALAALELSDGQAPRLVVRWVDGGEGQSAGLRFRMIGCGESLASLPADMVFDPFSAPDSGQDPLTPAVRFALASASRIARQLHGQVEVGRQPSGHSALVLSIGCASDENAGTIPPLDFAARHEPWRERLALSSSDRSPMLEGRILIAASDDDLGERLETLLKRAGAQASTVRDGAAAYARAAAADDTGQPFDVVLLDDPLAELEVPAAASRLRHAGFPGLILALVDAEDKHARRDWLSAGCDDLIAKPIDPAALLSLLQRQVRPATPATPVPSAAPPTTPKMPALPALAPGASPLNAEAGRFVDDLQRWVNQLEKALGEGDLLALAMVAAQTRSAAGFWGLKPLAAAAEQLEVYSQRNAGLESLVNCVEKLTTLCREVMEARSGV